MSEDNYILQALNISKSFPGVIALNNVSINIKRDTVHAIVGENGAGKSTLMNILSGMYTKFEGEIIYENIKLRLKSVHDATNHGISMIHQELDYVPNMTVAQNLFLGREVVRKIPFFINDKELNKSAKEILSNFDIEIHPNFLMRRLNVAQKQVVEVLKAISRNLKLIIMDEPTSALSLEEVSRLMKIIKELRNKNITIIYVSHKMNEVFKIADEITVLRDSKSMGTYSKDSINIDDVVTLMIGNKLKKSIPKRILNFNKAQLCINNLSRGESFKNITFCLKKGEILGIVGLMGSGRTEVARCIFGLDKYDKGEIILNGKKVNIGSPSDAVKLGINYISEDRKEIGLILSLSVKKNISLANLGVCSFGPFILEKKENKIVDELIDRISIKTPNREQIVKFLSGGNQQKVVIAKALMAQSEILIFDEPTKGIDVGAKREIYNLMRELKNAGKSIIMISSEFKEIEEISDRVIVFHKGTICKELIGEDIKEEIIIKYSISA